MDNKIHPMKEKLSRSRKIVKHVRNICKALKSKKRGLFVSDINGATEEAIDKINCGWNKGSFFSDFTLVI